MSEEQLTALLAKLKDDVGLQEKSSRVLQTLMLQLLWQRKQGLMSARLIGSNIRQSRPQVS
jgi:hypothetical protein